MKPLPDFVTCGHCGETWSLQTRPYPLANGICHDCRRHLKKPNYLLAAEVDRLREALETIGTKCSTFTEPSTCISAERTRGARYLADAWCDQCIAREALRNAS